MLLAEQQADYPRTAITLLDYPVCLNPDMCIFSMRFLALRGQCCPRARCIARPYLDPVAPTAHVALGWLDVSETASRFHLHSSALLASQTTRNLCSAGNMRETEMHEHLPIDIFDIGSPMLSCARWAHASCPIWLGAWPREQRYAAAGKHGARCLPASLSSVSWPDSVSLSAA